MEKLKQNLYKLTEEELSLYASLIQARSNRQLIQLFVYELLLMVTGIGFTFLSLGLLGSGLCAVFFIVAAFMLPVFMYPHTFLPFKITVTANQTIYNWRTRHSPEWMYRDYLRAGNFCLLYGDAVATQDSLTKPDL